MIGHIRLAVVAGLLCLACGLSGCVKLRQALTLMPDGSGKVELRFALSESLVKLSQQNDEDPFKEVMPDVISDKSKGIAAFSEPKLTKQGDFTVMTYWAYFKDINKLSIVGLGETQPAKYRYTREGDRATLSVTDGVILSVIAENEPTAEDKRAAVREAMAGLELSEHFILPGKIDPIDGVATTGNTAKIDLTLDHYLEGSGPIEKLKDTKSLTFNVPAVLIDEQAVAAFEEELAQAIAKQKAK